MSRQYAPNNIRKLRKERSMSMEELALAISPDVGMTTIAKLETGRMALSLDWTLKIAAALGVSKHDIIADDDGFRMLPLIGKIAAGGWAEALENPLRYMPVPGTDLTGREFILQVHGDSMNQLVDDGGFVVVDPDKVELKAGKLYALRNGEGDTTFKRFEDSPPRLVPCSTNPVHQPILVGQEPFTVIGRVKRGWRDFG